jgi:hypothetical protein
MEADVADRTASTSGVATPAAPRQAAQIKADIAQRQARLAGTVDLIADRVAPKNVIERTKATVIGQFVDPERGPRYDRIGILGGVVAAVLLLRIRRSRRK